MYHAMSYSSILVMQAAMTFAPKDMDAAMASLRESLQTCQRYALMSRSCGPLTVRRSELANFVKICIRPASHIDISTLGEMLHQELQLVIVAVGLAATSGGYGHASSYLNLHHVFPT